MSTPPIEMEFDVLATRASARKLLRLVVFPGMSGRWKVPSNVEPGGERWLRDLGLRLSLALRYASSGRFFCVANALSASIVIMCTSFSLDCKHPRSILAVLRPAPTHRRGLQPYTSGCPLFLVAITPAYPSFRRPADPASPSRISEPCGSHRAIAPRPRIPDLGHACTSAARAF